MNLIKKPIKLVLYYLPCGYGYKNKKDGFLSLTINNSKADKYSMGIKERDMSIRQLEQYLQKCLEGEINNEN